MLVPGTIGVILRLKAQGSSFVVHCTTFACDPGYGIARIELHSGLCREYTP